MRFHLIRVLGLVVGLTVVLAMASIAAAAPLSDQQISRQIENRCRRTTRSRTSRSRFRSPW